MNKLNSEQRRMVEQNLGLVHHVLKQMNVRRDYEDLFGAGCLALCRAAGLWHMGGAPFSTYACHLIRYEILRAITALSKNGNIQEMKENDVEISEPGFDRIETAVMKEEIECYIRRVMDQREADVVSCLIHGMSVSRTAQVLGVSLSFCYAARNRASEILKGWFFN